MNDTHQSFNNITNGISKLKADRRAIVSSEASLRSTIEAFKVGTQTMLDVLQSQQDLFDTLRTYAADQYDYINATIALKEAAGTLTYLDLIEINKLLTTASQSFSAVRTRAFKKNPLDFNDSTVPPKDILGIKGVNLDGSIKRGTSKKQKSRHHKATSKKTN